MPTNREHPPESPIASGAHPLVPPPDASDTLDDQRHALARALRHDLGNMVNALSGYAALLERSGPLNAEQSKWLGRLQQLAVKLSEAARELPDLAWIEAGLPLRCEPFHLSAAITAALEACAEEAAQRDITLSAEVSPDLPPLRGDSEFVARALRHLIENGLRYAAPGTAIRVRAWRDGDIVACAVQDEGIGIDPREQVHVWDRLWRSPDPRVQAIPGGGIGLTLVRAMVQRHGGTVRLESAPEQGTTVTISLPAGESA